MIYRIQYGERKNNESLSATFVKANNIVDAAEFAHRIEATTGYDIIDIKTYTTAPRQYRGEWIDPKTIIKIY